MARCLLAAGDQVTVWNRGRAAADLLAAKDLHLVSEFAADLWLSMPTTQVVAREVDAACTAGS